MSGSIIGAAQLSAELGAIEDRFVWDIPVTLTAATAIEAAAAALGQDDLVARAQVCQANMRMRRGDLAGASRQLWRVDERARENGWSMIRARARLILASVHQLLGEPATTLEHAIRAVEYLDDTASVHAQVWHRAKLADALFVVGSIEAARTRFAQAEQLAAAHGQNRLHMAVLNNYAYSEFCAGAYDQAEQVAARLQAMAVAYGFALDPASLDTIGNIQNVNGRYAEAEQTLYLCLAVHSEGHHDDADSLAEYLLTLCRAQRGQGATARAQATLDRSRAICAERGLGEIMVRVHEEQAELHAARGEFAEAFTTHKIFFRAHHELHSAQREARARTRQAIFETAEARREAEHFREQARTDPLTGLRNRRYVDEQLPILIADARRPLTIAILDLDHFKRVNDQLSHDVGDQVLKRVAALLEAEINAVAPGGFVARMGGEEFLVVLPGSGPAEAADQLEAFRRVIRTYAWPPVTGPLPVTVSIGVASTCDISDPSQAGLLSIADRNLYLAKRHGRDQVVSNVAAGGRRRYRDSDPAA